MCVCFVLRVLPRSPGALGQPLHRKEGRWVLRTAWLEGAASRTVGFSEL